MKYIRTLVAAVAVAPVALLLGLLGANTASAETINCPNVNTVVVNGDCKATVSVTDSGETNSRLNLEVETSDTIDNVKAKIHVQDQQRLVIG